MRHLPPPTPAEWGCANIERSRRWRGRGHDEITDAESYTQRVLAVARTRWAALTGTGRLPESVYGFVRWFAPAGYCRRVPSDYVSVDAMRSIRGAYRRVSYDPDRMASWGDLAKELVDELGDEHRTVRIDTVAALWWVANPRPYTPGSPYNVSPETIADYIIAGLDPISRIVNPETEHLIRRGSGRVRDRIRALERIPAALVSALGCGGRGGVSLRALKLLARLRPAFARWLGDFATQENRVDELRTRRSCVRLIADAHALWIAHADDRRRLMDARVSASEWYDVLVDRYINDDQRGGESMTFEFSSAIDRVAVWETGLSSALASRLRHDGRPMLPSNHRPPRIRASSFSEAVDVRKRELLEALDALKAIDGFEDVERFVVARMCPEYPGVSRTIAEKIRAGISPREIAIESGAELSRREAHEWLSSWSGGSGMSAVGFLMGLADDALERVCGARGASGARVRSQRIARWVMWICGSDDRVAQLTRTRVAIGPRGQRRQFRYLDILDEVMDWDIHTGRDPLNRVFERAAQRKADRVLRRAQNSTAPEKPAVDFAERYAAALKACPAVHVLLSWADLAEEGATMHHCVATYIDAVRRGQCVILSIVENDGEDCSTVEITHELRVLQHRGRSNSAPPLACVKTLENFIEIARESERRAT